MKLRRSLNYDLIQGFWKVGHSFTKSSKVTFMRSLSPSRTERRCYAYSYAVTFHRKLRAEHRSKKFWWHWRRLQTTSRALLEVASVTHIRSDSRILKSWSLIYEVERSYIMRSLSASRRERRCYAYSFEVTNHRTLSARQWSKMCRWLWRRWTSCFAQI